MSIAQVKRVVIGKGRRCDVFVLEEIQYRGRLI